MLVIVDLQDCYIREFRQQRESIKRLLDLLRIRVAEARKNGEEIINLICPMDGPPVPEIEEMLGPDYTNLGKECYDGSEDIHRYIQRHHISPHEIELCGVFANVCVLHTWKGLKKFGYNVLPVKRTMTLFTYTTKEKVDTYPEGYLSN